MSFDDAYGALTDHDDDARWAYGTGFADPLAGVPTAVPDGRGRGRPGRVLPDARRRRADHVAPAAAVGDPRARAGGRAGDRQHRPRPARPGAAAADPGRRGRGRRAGTRTRSPTCGTPTTSATCGWPNAPTPTSRIWWPGCWSSRRGGWRCSTGWPASRRPGAGGDRRQGRQGGHLPPRVRGAVGGPPGRRHRAVAPAHAGGDRRGVAADRRAVPPARGRAAPGGAGVAVDPSTLRAEFDARASTQVLDRPPTPAPARPAGAPTADVRLRAAGATACTPRRWPRSSPRCRRWPGRCPEVCGDRGRRGRRRSPIPSCPC